MRLIIRDDESEACNYVANYVVERINAFQPTPEHPFILGLPTGSSPIGVYDMLVRKYKAGEVSFENVVTFNMDEYVGLPRDDPNSYHSFMWKHFFSHVNIHPSNVHILNGNAASPEAECDAYEEAIKAAGGIDLFLAGIGEDGHIAFNEPGSSLASRTRVKTLAYDTILSNSRFFGNDVSRVPRMALTVGVQTVLEAREVVVIILGARKALALQKCVEQGVNHMWSLSCLQLHPHPMIVVDEDATLELQVKTVKYFKSIEKVAREQGFEQILPSKVRTGNVTIPETKIQRAQSPTIIAPEPIASHLLRATPAGDYTMRTPSPDLFPDRMASRIPEPNLNRRLTPNLEVQTDVPKTKVEMIDSAVALSPERTMSDLLQPIAANINTMRSPSPDLVPDRMASRIPEPDLNRRLTPKPELQNRANAVGAH
ncbi:probable glucosamine-6-phosphate isomerase [Fusarium torulosum]|uniref:Glucosamine-6-phosphate deaminase n=1 Tax=Fusarium torulosum TaxID=33205 RepID=A0AAE8M1E8_9HYPO|nr:probable glucosamine-6-phosphate isomerase [Fusarium torulosum]